MNLSRVLNGKRTGVSRRYLKIGFGRCAIWSLELCLRDKNLLCKLELTQLQAPADTGGFYLSEI